MSENSLEVMTFIHTSINFLSIQHKVAKTCHGQVDVEPRGHTSPAEGCGLRIFDLKYILRASGAEPKPGYPEKSVAQPGRKTDNGRVQV